MGGATGGGGTNARGGTGGSNGGRGGGAGTAAGGTGGATDPCAARSGLRFCDTFESKSVGTFATAAPWVLQGGTVTIDGTTPAHSGSKSVRVHATDTDYDTLFVLHDATILPAPNGRFFLRAYMRLSRAMAGGHNAFIIADPYAMQGTGNNVRIGEMNAMLMYTIMGDGHGALSNQNFYNDGKPGVAFTPSTWVCLEALIDHTRPEIDVWVDGTEVPDLHHTDWPLDTYDSVRFGFEKYAGPASTSGTTMSPSGPNASVVTEAAAQALGPAAADPGSPSPRRRRGRSRGTCAPPRGTPGVWKRRRPFSRRTSCLPCSISWKTIHATK